ncbi:MAG: deoxyribose-phosphate aldolase [Buchananella hordeovulneris]|nr:deoxyribose-phosphate aldolase [Buchananella hordeovulneris]
MNRAEVAQLIDHTLLKPEASKEAVDALIAQAVELGCYSVCVSPNKLPLDREALGEVKVATVCGFPSGAHDSRVKALEAQLACEAGADEVDMVIDVSRAVAGDYDYVRADIAAVRAACPAPVVLKVIIESAALSDEAIVECCKAAEAAGADFVKTSTGFHPAGGASVHAVSLMAATVGGRLGVKASGGIRTAQAAKEMIEAGATRLGLSASADILAELDQ